MVKSLTAAVLVLATGCGAILNGSQSTITPPPGGMVDGNPHPIFASNHTAHEIVYPDGRRCIIDSQVSVTYIVLDVLLSGLIGIVVDAATSDWNVLDESACPGVGIQ